MVRLTSVFPAARSAALPVVLLAALLVTACGSSGPARQDIYYRLDPRAQPEAAASVWPGTLLVSKFDGRGFAGDRAIVFRDAGKPDQVQRYTYHLWAEAPPLTVQDLFAGYLRAARVADYVVTPAQRVNADLVISGTLFRFEHRPFTQPSTVRIEMELAVVRTDTRALVFLKRYETDVDAASEAIAAAIPAFNHGLEGIFDEFLRDLAAPLQALDPPRRSTRASSRGRR